MTGPKPEYDAYGNPVPPQAWRGYTLKDLAEYARTGRPVSTVQPNETGYGLDEVGNADRYQAGATKRKPFPWRTVINGLEGGLIGLQKGPGAAAAFADDRRTSVRRDALTDSQVRAQQSLIDERTMGMLDQPRKNAHEDLKWQLEMDAQRARLRALEAGIGLREGRQPSLIDADKARAEASRASAWRARNYFPSSGANDPQKQELSAVERQLDDTRADIGIAKRGMPTLGMLSSPADSALNRSIGAELGALQGRRDSLGVVRDSLAARVQDRPFQRNQRGVVLPRTPTTRSPMLQGFGGVPFGEQPEPNTAGPFAQREPVSQEDYDDIVALYGEDYAAENYAVTDE